MNRQIKIKKPGNNSLISGNASIAEGKVKARLPFKEVDLLKGVKALYPHQQPFKTVYIIT